MFLPENIDLAHSEEYNLSIRLAPDGFSFVIHSSNDPSVFHYQGTALGNKLSPADHIKKVIFDLGFFSQPFKRTSVTVVTPRYTMVPENFYDRKKVKELYLFNIYQEENESVLTNNFREGSCHILFGMEEELHSFLSRNLWNPKFLHHSRPLMQHFRKRATTMERKCCFVDFHDRSMTIIAFSGETLLSANSYPALNSHDTTFYIASVWEKLNLNQSADILFLSGDFASQKPTVDILNKLIRNVEQLEFNPPVVADQELLLRLPTDLLITLCE